MGEVTSFKKCPSCGHMSVWHLKEEDRCEHCGARLTSQEKVNKRIAEEEQEQIKTESILDIKPGDSPFTIFIKKVGWVFHMIFMAILSFFIWVISIATG
jgi:uncharacterized membrane protein YvbJ